MPSPSTRHQITPASQLSFLSLVNPARIPLYLAAGPSLTVWTTNQVTEDWLSDVYLHDAPERDGDAPALPWWKTSVAQAGIAILLRVDDGSGCEQERTTPRVTELLLYGTVSTPNAAHALPTPPGSSSPGFSAVETETREEGQAPKQLTVHALPLSSDLLCRPSEVPLAPANTPSDASSRPEGIETTDLIGSGELHFLPFNSSECQLPPVKRRRTDTLFDEAAERRKKARRKDGRSISKLMAEVTAEAEARKPLKVDEAGTCEGQLKNDGQSPAMQLPRPNLTRSISIAVDRGDKESSRLDKQTDGQPPRPLSHSRTPSLTQHMPTLPAELSDRVSAEKHNKETLSKLIMASMRTYGLQQRKKLPRWHATMSATPAGLDHDSQNPHISDETDEYKMIYHQTYKGACFALVRNPLTRGFLLGVPLHTSRVLIMNGQSRGGISGTSVWRPKICGIRWRNCWSFSVSIRWILATLEASLVELVGSSAV